MRILRLFPIAAAITCTFAAGASAATPRAGIEALGSQVSDADLAEMRGKFIRPNDIAYFGIEMLTNWQSADGITTQARLVVSLDFASAGGVDDVTPQLLVAWTREGDSSLDVTGSSTLAGASIPVGGLDSVHGFVQHQQIAGNDNQVRNAMNVAVVPAGTLTLNTDGMTPLTAPQNVQFADGDTIQFQLGGNQVGMTLTEGSDAARQAISGSLSQLSQHVIIDSNANNITNHMNAVIGFDPSTQANQLNVQNAVNALSGFGF